MEGTEAEGVEGVEADTHRRKIAECATGKRGGEERGWYHRNGTVVGGMTDRTRSADVEGTMTGREAGTCVEEEVTRTIETHACLAIAVGETPEQICGSKYQYCNSGG